MGSGSVGEAQLIESVYAQAYPYEQPPDWSTFSMQSCMDGIAVSWPKRWAKSWSMEVPT